MLLNKIFIAILAVIGIALGNVWICLSIVPAAIVNIIVYALIVSSKEEYPSLIRKQLLAKDIETLNKNFFMQMLILVSRICLAASFGYIAYLVSMKFFGVIQL